MSKALILWLSSIVIFITFLIYWSANNIQQPSDLEIVTLLLDIAVGSIAFLFILAQVVRDTKKRIKEDILKLKENIYKQKITFRKTSLYRHINWVVLALIILSFWFYWFQLRPSTIRKECFQNVKIKSDQMGVTKKEANNLYKLCLVKNGMKVEAFLDE